MPANDDRPESLPDPSGSDMKQSVCHREAGEPDDFVERLLSREGTIPAHLELDPDHGSTSGAAQRP